MTEMGGVIQWDVITAILCYSFFMIGNKYKIKIEFEKDLQKLGVSTLVLFGSAATSVKKPDDVDVAVFLNDAALTAAETDYNKEFEIFMAVVEAFGKSSKKEVDLVLMSPKISPLLQYHIARDGKLLFGSERDFMHFRLRAIKVYQDTRKFREALWSYLEKAYAR